MSWVRNMLSEKAWAYILSRRRLSRIIGVLSIFYLLIFVPWLVGEGYVIDMQSRINTRHDVRMSNYQHAFHENFILGTNLGNTGAVIRTGGILVHVMDSNTVTSTIINQSWVQWGLPSNYSMLIMTINTSSISLGTLKVNITIEGSMIKEPLELSPGQEATSVINLDHLGTGQPLIILFEVDDGVAFDVWAEPSGDIVPIPPIVHLTRYLHGMLAPPLLLALTISTGYMSFLLIRFYYVGWKLEKTQGLLARLKWEKLQLGVQATSNPEEAKDEVT